MRRARLQGRGRGGAVRASFTLVELLIVSAIIAIIASSTLFALYGVMEDARGVRTRSQIIKIDEMLMQQWESFRARKISIVMPPGLSFEQRAQVRLHAIREMMRMALPDRITDLTWSPTPEPITSSMAGTANTISDPSAWRAHRRRAGFSRTVPGPWPREAPAYSSNYSAAQTTTGWTIEYQGSECLYLIMASIRDGEDTALDFFKQSEIGDTDGDGMFELLDAWGRPIEFLRWAPGYATLPGPDGAWGRAGVDDNNDGTTDNRAEVGSIGSDDRSEIQSRDPSESPDPFDPLRADPRYRPPNTDPRDDPYCLFPLIYSAGPDGEYDIVAEVLNNGNPFAYATTSPSNDPYAVIVANITTQMGRAGNAAQDNITNHLLEAE